MSKRATRIVLTDEERAALERVLRGAKTERRMSERSRIVLAAARGLSGLFRSLTCRNHMI